MSKDKNNQPDKNEPFDPDKVIEEYFVKKKRRQCLIIYTIIACVALVTLIYTGVRVFNIKDSGFAPMQEITYTSFLEEVKNNQVDVIFPASISTDDTSAVHYFFYANYNDETKDMDFEERSKYTYPLAEIKKCINPSYDEFLKDMLESNIRVQKYEIPGINTMRVVLGITLWVMLTASAMVALALYVLSLPSTGKILRQYNEKFHTINKKSNENQFSEEDDSYAVPKTKQAMAKEAWREIKDKAFKKTESGNEKLLSFKDSEYIQTSDVKFDDIIGHDEALEEIRFITKLIKNPELGDVIGARVPHGILFAGPPGTGKTMLAKAIANEAGVPFLYQNASSFIELYVGTGAKRVRNLFKAARKHAPCIIFIDEIDAIGLSRSAKRSTSSEDLQTINALLQEMDGFKKHDNIFIIAATNNPDGLDEALVRAGRFDRQVTINPPRDWEVRKDLFKNYLSKCKVNNNVDLDNLSRQTAGFTGADIASICNEAGIIAIMNDKREIDTACLEEAIDKKVFKGSRAKKAAHMHDKEIIAYHEAGHAVMSYLLGEPIARASIQSTTSGVGGAVFNEDNNTVFHTKTYIEHRIMIAYAGRASEEIKFKEITTGAANDITNATELITQYVEKMGFDESFGLLDIGVLTTNHMVSDTIINEKMSSMSVQLYDQTKKTLKESYDMVEKLAQELLKVETLTGTEIDALFAKD